MDIPVTLLPHKKIFFASDFHLGAANHADSLVREKKIVAWLDAIKHEAQMVCLVGDLFDFWFEYRRVVPKGFVRFFGKLAELSDAGVEILVCPGNHDMWVKDYFQKEFNIKTYRKPVQLSVNDGRNVKTFYVTHGDGLGPGDYSYKMLRHVFEGRLSKWLFGTVLHADLGLALGQAWANYSWQKHQKEGQPQYLGENQEWLVQYAKEVESGQHHDYYIFGHRHILLDLAISSKSRIIILGDWISYFSYGVFDGNDFELKIFDT